MLSAFQRHQLLAQRLLQLRVGDGDDRRHFDLRGLRLLLRRPFVVVLVVDDGHGGACMRAVKRSKAAWGFARRRHAEGSRRNERAADLRVKATSIQRVSSLLGKQA